jgi:sec-independent protein translocase protein TatA
MYQGTLLEFLNMGGGEIMLIMVVVLLLFGGKKLPELARGLGKGIREFKDASEGVKREIHRNINSVDVVEEANPTFNTETPAPVSTTPSIHEQMYGTEINTASSTTTTNTEPAVHPAEPTEIQKNHI